MEQYLYREMYEQQNKHWWFVGRTKIILSLINKYLRNTQKPIKILDIGCGTGKMLREMSSFGEAYGLDSSEEAISFCKQYCSQKVMKGFLPNENPYRNQVFDLILALDVLEHIEDDREVIKCIYEMLSDSGYGIITVPAYMFLWSNHDEVHNHKRRYILTELKKKLEQAGFEIQKISYFNTFLFLPILLVRMLSKVIGRRNNSSDLGVSISRLNFIFEKIFSFERHLLNLFKLPFGVSIIAVVKKR